jgi:GNAT superfamily N-acetyltransferase
MPPPVLAGGHRFSCQNPSLLEDHSMLDIRELTAEEVETLSLPLRHEIYGEEMGILRESGVVGDIYDQHSITYGAFVNQQFSGSFRVVVAESVLGLPSGKYLPPQTKSYVNCGEISRGVVKPEYRKQGVGYHLLRYTVKKAPEIQIKHLFAGVGTKFTRLLSDLGFVLIGETNQYESGDVKTNYRCSFYYLDLS